MRLADLWMAACAPAEVDELAAVLIREDRPEPPPRMFAPEPAGEVSFDFGANAQAGEPGGAGG